MQMRMLVLSEVLVDVLYFGWQEKEMTYYVLLLLLLFFLMRIMNIIKNTKCLITILLMEKNSLKPIFSIAVIFTSVEY